MNYNNVSFVTSCGVSDQIPPCDKAEVCFSGRSNVGISSLINKLLNRKSMARVSTKPGKTATINFFNLDEKINLCDLPGYGYAKVSDAEKLRWSELMEYYFSSGRDIRLVVQLIDMRHAPSKQDIEMIEYMKENNIPFVVALTKCDKLNKTERMNMLEEICGILTKYGNISVVPFSATKGDGVEELRNLIEKSLV